ncbi:Gfo/Idh/MocA family oxidoreductase [Pseudogracilibacillus sp. SO30301A]|uniref:Gfo/Idh/MocA family oxidoreductase n=1 Tax=Pseudogracilibacillus sp. SO30301A TaxID=3098291 RepID=UPI00300E4BE7
MSNTINCAVLGTGRLGYVHAKNLVEHIPGANLKTIVTSRMESAEKAAKELGVENWTNDVLDVLEDDGVDAVVIVTPTKTHVDLIKQAAKHKKHIFVDKPITETVKEADEVIQEVQQNKVICQVGFMRRFDPSYQEAKRRIENGDIGRPVYFKGLSRDPGSPPESYIKTSGGIFIDLCIHEYDIARFLLDSEVKSIQTFGEIHKHPFMLKYGDVDQSLSYLQFENGASADIEGSRNSSFGYDIRGEVVGTEGMIQISSIQYHNNIILTKNKTYYDNIPDFRTKFETAFIKELEHFVECVQHNRKPIVNETDGKIALQISEAAKKSFQLKERIYI